MIGFVKANELMQYYSKEAPILHTANETVERWILTISWSLKHIEILKFLFCKNFLILNFKNLKIFNLAFLQLIIFCILFFYWSTRFWM